MALSTAEQNELDELEYQKLLSEKRQALGEPASATSTYQEKNSEVKQSEEPEKRELNSVSDLAAFPGKLLKDVNARADELKAAGWQNLSTGERFELLMTSLPKYAKQEVLGKAEGLAERSVPIAVGQFAGRATKIPGADRVLGAIGGAAGEAIAETREGGSIRPGAVASAALSGLVRGKPLAGPNAASLGSEAAKYAVTNLAGKATETAIDEGRLPTLGETAESLGSGASGAVLAKVLSKVVPSEQTRAPLYNLENETFKDLRKEGAVVPPSRVEGGHALATGIAGNSALEQEAVKRNQFVWQKLARDDIGLSKEALPIRKTELDQVRDQASEPYRKIQSIQENAEREYKTRLAELARESDPHAAMMALEEPATKQSLTILHDLSEANVDKLKEARATMQRSARAFFNGKPEFYEPWQAAKSEVDRLEGAIDKAATLVGDDKLLERLRASRKTIAQTYTIEDALNPGNGFVDPLAFGRQVLNGKKLSGNLEKIAKFQLAFRREAVEASQQGLPEATDITREGMMKAVLHKTAGKAARPFLLSDMVQNDMLTPRERQNFAAVMGRYLAEKADETVDEPDQEEP